MYKLYLSSLGQQFILDVERNAFIPFDPANTDYQAYLKWLEEGGVPTPADDVPQE